MYNFEYQTFTSYSIFFLLGIITFTEVKDNLLHYKNNADIFKLWVKLNYDHGYCC